MRQQDFEELLADTTKQINENIHWQIDEDHSPTVEFRVNVMSLASYPLFVRGFVTRTPNCICAGSTCFWPICNGLATRFSDQT
jgi:hypothetical protein